MADILTMDDINEESRGQIYTQDYSTKPSIEGVKIIPVRNFVSEDGDFSELVRLDDGQIEGVENFTVKQINRSRLLPNSIKGWHLHFGQDDIWYLPPSNSLLVGLWDLRKNSKSNGTSVKIALGGGQSSLLFIPRGVAHGMVNVSGKDINLFYFVNQQFDMNNPDEKRLPWDALGEDFWTPKKD